METTIDAVQEVKQSPILATIPKSSQAAFIAEDISIHDSGSDVLAALLDISLPYMQRDKELWKLAEIAKAGHSWVNEAYTPIHIHIPLYDIRLYFWGGNDTNQWIKDYMRVTGDFACEDIQVFEMYSASKVNTLNDHTREDRVASGEMLLGDSIVNDGYTYKMNKTVYHFVQRYVHHEIKLAWSNRH